MLKKLLISCFTLFVLVGIYAAAGFYLLPKLVVDKLPKFLTEMTGQPVKLSHVQFDPFQLTAAIQNFELSTNDAKPLLSFAELYVDVAVIESVKQHRVIVESVALRKPLADIKRHQDGRFNFSDLVDKLSQPKAESKVSESQESSGSPAVLIHQLILEEGHVTWSDLSSGQVIQETILPLDFSIAELSTQPDASSKFNLRFALASGGNLDWQGDIDLTALKSQGQISLKGLTLNKVWQMFLQDAMPLEITDGLLALQANYTFSSNEKSGLAVVVNNANVDISKLALKAQNQPDTLILLPELSAHKIDFNLQNQQLTIGGVSGKDAQIKAWLQPDGQVNYQALFASKAGTAANPVNDNQTTQPEKPWQVELHELALNNYQINFTDKSQSKPVDLVLSELHIGLRDYSNTDNRRLPLELTGRLNQAGRLSLKGETGLEPFSANWAVELKDIKLKTFQTYVDPFINLELADGDLNTQGHLQLKAADELGLIYQGDANIESLVTRDKVKNLDFVKWANLEFKQMVLDVAKQDYKLAKVVFDQPYFRFMIKKDGTNNVSDLLVAQADNKPKPVAKKQPEKTKKASQADQTSDPKITIGKIEFQKGGSDFADYSLFLPFVVKINSLSGAVDGFSSYSDEALKLKLQGKVYDMATVDIKGQYQIKKGDSDIVLKFNNMPLPLITPYMADFAGYKIEKGKMALDLAYNVKQAQLTAQNKIVIEQLKLGEKVDNPKAVSLPLELGIALLKDADGKIDLDFPISGSLEDPQFSVGSLVADIFVNLITKAVSSPFKLLGSVFDGDADLSTVSFNAGSGELTPEESSKLDHLAKALEGKPDLVLEVKGIAYQSQDWPVMRFDALKDILKKMKSGELRDKGEKIRHEYLELSDDDYKRLLAKFYAEVFPEKIDRSLLGKPRIKDKPDGDFYELARVELESKMDPDPERLNDLAVNRANHIAKYLAEKSGVDRARIYILATELDTKNEQKGINALLSLNVAS